MNIVIFLLSWFIIFYFYGKNSQLKTLLEEKEQELELAHDLLRGKGNVEG